MKDHRHPGLWRFGAHLTFTLCLVLISPTLSAYNYLYIHPTTGEPVGWEHGTTIQYWLDPGPLGRFTNDQARVLVQEAMKIWEEASPYANVPHFEFVGYLPEDINGTNYQEYVSLFSCYEDDLGSCPTQAQKDLKTVIIFDEDDSILNNELCKITNCSALAGARVFEGSGSNPGFIKQGIFVLGSFGGADTTRVSAVMGTMIHEIGHLLGLAHTSINQEAYIDSNEEFDRYMVSMFIAISGTPVDQEVTGATLNPDDIAGISVLYPSETFATDTATIKGKILKADETPNYYTNVIARNVDDPLCEAFSFLAGRICQFASSAVFCDEPVDNNSEYIIWGLPPGTYTLEVEDIADDNLAMTLAPGLVDPFIYGDAEFWNEGDAAGDASYLTSNTITLAAGETRENVDIILNRSEVTDARIKYIPLDTFTPGPGTRCPEEPPVDYAEMIGIDEGDSSTGSTDSTTSGSSGGCSLVR